jgi:hypothetical protein
MLRSLLIIAIEKMWGSRQMLTAYSTEWNRTKVSHEKPFQHVINMCTFSARFPSVTERKYGRFAVQRGSH